jgi:hypothetical protein
MLVLLLLWLLLQDVWTPLHLAVMHGQLEVVVRLLVAGADTNIKAKVALPTLATSDSACGPLCYPFGNKHRVPLRCLHTRLHIAAEHTMRTSPGRAIEYRKSQHMYLQYLACRLTQVECM